MFKSLSMSNPSIRLSLILFLVGCSKGLLAAEFLVISDIHFNPLAGLNKKQFLELNQLPIEEWPTFFQSLNQPLSQAGSDSNFSLTVAALDAAKRHSPKAAFVLYPGDLMAHDWQATYEQLAPQTIANNPTAFREFTKKALSLLRNEFKRRFPEIPVHVTLGNDDSFCQDYWIQPGGDYLSTFAEVWEPLIGNEKDRLAFRESFPELGTYSVDLPDLGTERILVVNSVLWSASYCCDYFMPKDQGCCGCINPGVSPGREQFQWIEGELSRAKKDGKRVWLLMHVPPGIDSYSEQKANGESQTAELWNKEFTDRYLKLVDEYRDTFRISFAGHTHMDDFRISRVEGLAVSLHKIAPAVSPIFGNNPAFQVFQVDDQTGEIENWQTYFVDIQRQKSNPPDTKWEREYDAKEIYGFSRVNTESMEEVFTKMRNAPNGSRAAAYRQHYAVNAKPVAQDDLFIYVCAVLNTNYAEFHNCVVNHGLSPPRKVDGPAKIIRAIGSSSQDTE